MFKTKKKAYQKGFTQYPRVHEEENMNEKYLEEFLQKEKENKKKKKGTK